MNQTVCNHFAFTNGPDVIDECVVRDMSDTRDTRDTCYKKDIEMDEPKETIPVDKHMMQFTSKFCAFELCAEGKYGIVYRAVTSGNQVVALKMKKPNCFFNGRDKWREEIYIHSMLNHPNIVKFLGEYNYCDHNSQIVNAIVLEYCEGGDLLTRLTNFQNVTDKPFTFPYDKWYFRQIVRGMMYAHQNCVVHRDLKLENILIAGPDNTIRICDWGFSTIVDPVFQPRVQSCCGSINYVSPEILNNLPYHGTEVDKWAMGVILFALLFICLPFTTSKIDVNKIEYNKKIAHKILHREFPKRFEHFYNGDAFDLICQFLHPNPNSRINLSDALNHQWFQFSN